VIEAYRVTVTTTPTLLVAGPATALFSHDAGTVFIGPSDVSTSTGFFLSNNPPSAVDVKNHDALYGVVTADTAVVQVLKFS
jgi:hypothetical protein